MTKWLEKTFWDLSMYFNNFSFVTHARWITTLLLVTKPKQRQPQVQLLETPFLKHSKLSPAWNLTADPNLLRGTSSETIKLAWKLEISDHKNSFIFQLLLNNENRSSYFDNAEMFKTVLRVQSSFDTTLTSTSRNGEVFTITLERNMQSHNATVRRMSVPLIIRCMNKHGVVKPLAMVCVSEINK